MAQPRVLVIGSSNIDFIMKVAHLPAVGETVTDGLFMQTFGGKGANQAVAAARAGGAVTFVTCLGHDVYAPTMKANFAADGIDVGRILDDPSQSSGTALVMIDERGRNYLTVAPGSNNTLGPAHIDALESEIADADVIVQQMEIPAPTNARVLELAARHGRTVVFNYAPTRGVPLAVGAAMGVLVVNENEAAELLGRQSVTQATAADAAAALQAMGPATVVVTLGEHGAIAVDARGATAVAGLTVAAVDTTAAGDTFCGALAVGIGEGRPMAEALRFANAAAALATTVMGAQPSVPRRADIDAKCAAAGATP